MSWWSRMFRKQDEPGVAATRPRGQYVNENPWGIHEGMSVKQVDRILKKNGFREVTVDLPGQFGADPPGYKYPCWTDGRSNITSTFKFDGLLEFSVH